MKLFGWWSLVLRLAWAKRISPRRAGRVLGQLVDRQRRTLSRFGLAAAAGTGLDYLDPASICERILTRRAKDGMVELELAKAAVREALAMERSSRALEARRP